MEPPHRQRRVQGHRGRLGLSAVTSPIGVFDSGIGGLSILQALRTELPQEHFVYVADSAHAPYGERDATHIIARSQAITAHLLQAHGIKALVVACNTATAAAIHLLRQQYPQLPIIGVEPALKPAAQLSRTGRVGVMATRGTLQSAKFRTLLETLPAHTDFILQACDGLADAIERGDTARTAALCRVYTADMGPFGTGAGQIDTLVLGCTHYPFAAAALHAQVGAQVQLIDSGGPVARQTRRLLLQHGQLASTAAGSIELAATGDATQLQSGARNWLQFERDCGKLSI